MRNIVGQLVPPFLEDSYHLVTMSDVLELGSVKINEFIRWWEFEERYIMELRHISRLFKNNPTQQEILKIVGKYVSPEIEYSDYSFEELMYSTVTHRNEVVVRITKIARDKASMERKGFETTLNICGWCRYQSITRYQHGNIIDVSCAIASFKNTDIVSHIPPGTPCSITGSSTEEFNKLSAFMRKDHNETTSLLQKIELKKSILSKLACRAVLNNV